MMVKPFIFIQEGVNVEKVDGFGNLQLVQQRVLNQIGQKETVDDLQLVAGDDVVGVLLAGIDDEHVSGADFVHIALESVLRFAADNVNKLDKVMAMELHREIPVVKITLDPERNPFLPKVPFA
jgi:hypothetical protein